MASAADEATQHGLSGVEMGDSDILLTLDPALNRELHTADEWLAYFDQEGAANGGHTSGVVAVVLPRLVDDISAREASATIGGDDLASNPLSRFAGFLYRVLSGMTAKQTAYLSTINYVSFSDISEESNHYLSHVISGVETPSSATAMLHQICQNEGGHFDGISTAVHRSVSSGNPAATMSAPPRDLIAPPPLPSASASASASVLVPPLPASASTMGSPAAMTASASGPPPLTASVSDAPSVAGVKKETTKSRSLLVPLAIAAVLLLGGFGAAGWYVWKNFSGKLLAGQTQNTESNVSVQKGTGEITFANMVMDDGTKNVALSLQDSKGVNLGKFTTDGIVGKVADFPLDVFKSADRWPLRFAALDSGWQVSGDLIEQSLFEKNSETAQSYSNIVKLSARASSLITPKFTFMGEPVGKSADLLKFLVSSGSSKPWIYQIENDAMRITLAEGQSFPIQAELNVPYMKTIKKTLKGNDHISDALELHSRTISLTGVTSEHQFTFEPDLNQIKDESIKELLRGRTKKVEITGAALNLSRNRWTIPSIAGSIKVDFSGQSNVVPVSAQTTHLVFVNQMSRLPTESKEMTELRLLAEKGAVNSQYNLGVMHYKTSQDDLSDRFAFQWFMAAAEEGDLGAKNEVGRAYLEGIGTDQNHALAFQWLSQAAEAKHVRAIGDLARCYEHGYGVAANLAKAEEFYLQAANLGDLDAMCNIGILYLDGKPANKEAEGAQWLQKAASSDHAYALYSLGFAYLNGVGVPTDRMKAKQLLTRSNELGNSQAKQLLSELGN
ncbi:MAG: hypothetical protein HC845_10995 [Akkermansiaceae bacterium]|nr:hypothetical protein [Akkermansiaceae bacterium]